MNDEQMIVEQLNALDDLQSQVSIERANKQAEVEKILPAEVRAQLAALDAEFEERIEEAEAKAAAMKASIQETVKAHGATVRGAQLMAVFSERTTWDSRRLAGYAQAHPEVNGFCKKMTSVSIRTMEK